FPVAICCKAEEEPCDEQPQQQGEQKTRDHDHDNDHHQDDDSPVHIGCRPGDWHPSQITVKELKELICCAWDYMLQKEQAAADAQATINRVQGNKTLIEAKVQADTASLEDRIKSKVEKVKCGHGCKERPCQSI